MLLLFATLAAASPILTKSVRLDIPENPIPGQYIAVFNKGVGSDSARSLASTFVNSKFFKIGSFMAFSAEMTPGQIASLQSKSDLFDYIAQDAVVTAYGEQTNPPAWGIDRVDQTALPLNQLYRYPDDAGRSATVYVLDTGIRVTHQEFGGRARWGVNYADSNNNDGNGHGTHCAGTVGGSSAGVAKQTNLVAVKVLGDSGSGSWTGVISGVQWVVDQCSGNPSVCSGSLSLGGGGYQPIDDAINAAVAEGVIMIIAAGNNGGNACNYSPARAASAFTVGATDINDNRASYSNFGTCMEIFAPGSNIYSAWSTSDVAYNTISGTSMATPHVAGAVALLQSASPANPATIASRLVAAATPNVVNNAGTGSPNLLLFVSQ
eukprot:TRINITY_DN122_c0_g1_i1.p1 TRINITY_DN122_c0_g1~~TRINITY_DN122_c0_g1_i1.p1  ORF type:complete len:390 (-),score=96.39 TRINITY_DN122_c0_g1_i1:48-1181(-)